MKYRDDRSKKEFGMIDARLQAILYFVEGYTRQNFDKEITLTHLIRTKEEQDRIYGANPRYVANPWTSVHQVNRGADIRSHSFTTDEINMIVNIVNSLFVYNNNLQTCIYHDVGAGAHIHFQVPHKERQVFN
jgi:hypothetical protein